MVPSVPSSLPAPEVVWIASRPEPVRLDHRGGLLEIACHRRRLVRVTGEGDRLAAGLVPPAHDLGPKGHDGADLQHAIRPGERPEHGADRVLEVSTVVPLRPAIVRWWHRSE